MKRKNATRQTSVPKHPLHAGVEDMDVDDLLAADILGAVNDRASDDVIDDDIDDDIDVTRCQDGDSSDSERASSSDDGSDLEFDQKDLEKLKETDPEFYEYLKDTDEGLLDFCPDDGGDADDGIDGEDRGGTGDNLEGGRDDLAGAEETSPQNVPSRSSMGVITSESIKSWCRAAQKNASIGAVRQVTRLYRIACHHGDGDGEDEESSLKLASSAVYNNILLFMLGKADGIFRKALGMAADEDGDPSMQERYPKYEPFIRSYLGNTLHLLGKVTDASMQAYILRRLRCSVPFLGDFDKIRRKYVALSLKIFSSAEDEARVQAILFVRACAIALPSLCLDMCLKGAYKSFVGASRFFTSASAPGIRFMASCVVDMYGIDVEATYQHAFLSIKGLASQMRQALTSKSKESYKEVYCWQTINALELWATVLVTHPSDLEPLYYPLSQLLLGACTLVGSPSFIPLRLKCIRMLNELAQTRNVYVPVAPLLVEVFQWKDLGKKCKPVPPNSIPDLNLRLRVGSSILRASSFQEDVVDTTLELLSSHLAQWGHHPGFLEISYIPLLRLRSFIKSSNKDRYKRGAKQLCQAIMDTQAVIGNARNRAQFSPKDASSIHQFVSDLVLAGQSPIGKLAATLREQAVQRMRMRSMKDAILEEDSDGEDIDEEGEYGEYGEYGEEYSGEDIIAAAEAPREGRGGKRHKQSARSTDTIHGDQDETSRGGTDDSDADDYEDKVEQYEFSDDDD
jgi:nucleolar complex protein 2